MKRLLCLISAVLLFSGVTFAQNVTISGRLQHEDNDPVFACAVYVSGTFKAYSDSLGHFSVSVPRDQSVTLHFEELSYRAQDITITPKKDCTLDVMMESDCRNDAIELKSLPDSCSICGSKKFVPVLYGLPSKKGLKLAKEGKCVLGGCIAGGDNDYRCVSCEQLYRIIK